MLKRHVGTARTSRAVPRKITARENPKIYNFPERGYVYDRDDKLIVSNEPYYDVLIVPNDVKISDSTRISKDLNISVEDFKLKYNKALKFSKIKASVFLSSITKQEYAQSLRKRQILAFHQLRPTSGQRTYPGIDEPLRCFL